MFMIIYGAFEAGEGVRELYRGVLPGVLGSGEKPIKQSE
jgi:hypothetical protein